MPKIRDWTFTYTSASTTQLTVPLPQYQKGDLLLAIMSADTGTQTWSSSGWTQLFSRTYNGATNRVNLGVLYKIAGESETDPTFSYTVAETSNGQLLAISDVDTSSPIADYGYADINANRGALPVKTASRNNSLVVYCSAHPEIATAIPSIIEGPVIQEWQADGAAHSHNVAWTFQPTAGNTPDNVYWTVTGTTYSSVLGCIVINPPSSGATQIPTYCAADNSVYVDPIHGTAAFRGNTAFAGTATTYWTSPLAGRTLANATVSNRADTGINTYRSTGGMTGPTTADTYQGATLVLSDTNRVNVTGKNVLVHAMPYVPADIQTVYDTALGKGIEFGMASSANNAITWHVHGANSPWGVNRAPIVVNEQNQSARIDTRGNFDKTLTKIFGFFTCGFITSSDWMWSMIWISDTTVVAGGNASSPVDIPGIVKAIASGHERMSAVLQGKNQMLLLQPLQIGDGGSHPVYLNLDSTAIEFPEIYNLTTRQTYYCSVPNYSGITYYAGPNDTIIHTNSIVSSASPYHFKLHSSSSTSATYDFSGLSVIGAGEIVLNKAITISEITINDYQTLDISNLTLENSTIINPPDSNNSITLNSSTTLDGCNIDVTTLSAGKYLFSTATPNKISNCTFTGSTSSGHAFRITSPGTYSLVGNTFTGFGDDDTTSAAIFNDSGGAVTLNISGGGNIPTVRNGTGASTTVNNVVIVEVNGVRSGEEKLTHGTISGGDGQFAVGNYLRGVTSGAVGTIREVVDSTHTIVGEIEGTFSSSEIVRETTDGTAAGDTGDQATISAKETMYVRCRVEAKAGGPLEEGTTIMNEEADVGPDSEGNYAAQAEVNFTENQPVLIRARYRGYKPFETSGVITSSGLTVTAVWQVDPNYREKQ